MSQETDGTAERDENAGGGETLTAKTPSVEAPIARDPDPRDRYDVRDEVGRGGLGIVLQARDHRLARTVAIKELRRLEEDDGAEARFLREARIAAQLEHPGIVPVHDIGFWPDGRPFYAMKLVSGRPLRALVDECERLEDRLALVPKVLAVAEAIAYAHQRGVIHRDLKPSNVIVGEHGETVVIDWGLAKNLRGDDADATEPDEIDELIEDGVTVAGEVLGTPAYMPPEQARGEEADERSDVYALGAMLYHALSGAFPYRGSSSAEVVEKVLAGPPTPLTEREPRIPQELAAIVTKAMARDPAERYPTAAGFEEDLRRFQTGQLVRAHEYSLRERMMRWAKRKRWHLAATAMASLGGLALFGLLRAPAIGPSCDVPADAFIESWSPELAARVRSSFDATGAKNADAVFEEVQSRLDEYEREWRRMRREACEATHERGVQSTEALDARMRCLDRRRDEVAALSRELANFEGGRKLWRAVGAVERLRPVSSCEDAEALLAGVPLPTGPEQRERIGDIRSRFEKVQAISNLGRYEEAIDLLEPLVEEARGSEYPPLLADVLAQRGTVLDRLGRYEEALSVFTDAAPVAARSRDDELVANIWLEIFLLHIDRLRSSKDAESLLPTVETAVARAGQKPAIQAKWKQNVGLLHWHKGEYEPAVDKLADALELYREVYGPEHPVVARALGDLGILHRHLGEYDAAEEYYLRANDVFVRSRGPHHPGRAGTLNNLGILYQIQERFEEALEYIRRALELKRAAYGQDTPSIANSLQVVAEINMDLGRNSRAEKLLREALSIREDLLGKEHPSSFHALYHLGRVKMAQGEYQSARQYVNRAIAIARKAHGDDHNFIAFSYNVLGDIALAEGKPARALEYCDDAVGRFEADVGKEHKWLGDPLKCVARARLEQGRPDMAIGLLERAVGLLDEEDGRSDRASPRFLLARALWQAGSDRERALELARDARDLLAGGSKRHAEDVTEIEEWLAERE